MMTKLQWEQVYASLDRMHRDFLGFKTMNKSGRTKTIRKTAEEDGRHTIQLTHSLLARNPEVSQLFKESEFGAMYREQEFWEFNYFGGDMADFLKLVKKKIDSFEQAH